MKNMKKVVATGMTALMVISMAACGSGGSGEGGDGGEQLKITLIPKIRQEAFWNAVESGAQAAADDLNVKLTIQGDPSGSNTAAKQATYVETATEKGEDAICFAALDSNTTDAALQNAMKAGIKVVGFDSDPGAEEIGRAHV